jgi:hypothetical protein
MANKKTKRGPGPEVMDAADPDVSLTIEGEELPIKEEWIPKFLDPKISFFDALSTIPDGGWENVIIYLYRLEPGVSNKAGDKKYIDVYSVPITEGSVKAQHGGGKFHAFVKYGEHTLRNHRFWIEGDPIYKEGQTLRGGPSAGVPAIPVGQDIGSIVRQVIEATGGNSKAADAGIEVMKRAFTDGLDLQKSISTRQAESTTGSQLGDKLFEVLIPRLLAPPTTPQTDPIVLELVKAAISNMKADRRDQNPSPAQAPPVADQLGLVKELLGVDSLREVIDLGRGGKEQPWWVAVASNLVEKLPSLLSEYAQMQERGFQRAIIAHQLGAGQVIPGQPAPMIRTEAVRVPPNVQNVQNVPAAPPSQGSMSEQMVTAIVEGICRAYDEGYPGDVAGAHIRLLYPQLVEQLRPLLSDPVQLSNFVAATPPLAERAQEPEWAQFQQEFVEEIGQQAAPPSGMASAESVPRETLAGPETAAAAPPRKPPAGKKKVNGTAA